jgi:hypothetical protein
MPAQILSQTLFKKLDVVLEQVRKLQELLLAVFDGSGLSRQERGTQMFVDLST